MVDLHARLPRQGSQRRARQRLRARSPHRGEPDQRDLQPAGHSLGPDDELRAIPMTTDWLGGTTYSFSNLTAFLANTPSTIQFLGDESAPSVFNNGATGLRHLQQEYLIGYVHDEWHSTPKLSLNYGLR